MGVTIQWDGSVAGRHGCGTSLTGSSYKVSDRVFTEDELEGAICTWSDGQSEELIKKYSWGGYWTGANYSYVYSDVAGQYFAGISAITLKEDGTYLPKNFKDGIALYVSTLYIPNATGDPMIYNPEPAPVTPVQIDPSALMQGFFVGDAIKRNR